MTAQTRPPSNAPDPRGLAIAREMQERLRPAEVILLGSRAAGDHRQDSDVDLMAVCPDEAAVVLDFTQNPGKVMDDITFVRSHWWLVSEGFSLSTANSDVQKLPATLYHRIADSLAYAA